MLLQGYLLLDRFVSKIYFAYYTALSGNIKENSKNNFAYYTASNRKRKDISMILSILIFNVIRVFLSFISDLALES